MLSNLKSPRVVAFITLSLLLLLTLASDVFADQVVNTIDTTVDPTLETRTITAGGSTIVSFYIRSQGGGGDIPGCNVDTVAATVNLSIPAGVTASPTSLTFNDCGNVNQNTQPVTFSSNLAGSYTIMVASVTGGEAGSLFDTAPATFTLVVNPPADTTPPVITPNVSGTLGNNGWYTSGVTVSWTVNDPESTITSTSGCDTTFITTDTSGTTLTCSATSAGGTASQSVTVKRDATAPVIDPHGDETAEATSALGAIVSYTAPATSDAGSGVGAANCAPTSGSQFALGDTIVTCNATDAAGNPAVATTFTVHVVDTTPPVIADNSDVTVEATSSAGAEVSFATPSASDFFLVGVTCDYASPHTFPLGTTTVTCTASDTSGNTASSSFDVTVVDTTPPVIAVHDDVTAEATSAAGAIVNYISPATFDAVDGVGTATCAPAPLSQFALGDTIVTCNATDAAGNPAVATTFTVHVVDTTPPVVTVPADITEEATGPSGAAVSFSVSASDIVDGAVAVSCDAASGDTFPLGTTLVSCSATDAAGNTGYGSFNITVEDTTPPVVTVPGDKTVEGNTLGGATVDFSSEVSAYDIVAGSVAVACTPDNDSLPLFEFFPLGTTPVDCYATDDFGNLGSASFNVTVVDTTPPVVTVPADITAEATGPSGAAVTFSASAYDIVDGDLAPTCSPASGSTFPLGTTEVDCSATDANGNTGTASFDVTVEDTTPPVISGAPANITAFATSNSQAVVTYTNPTASDLVDGIVPVTCAPPSGSTFPVGTTTVNCSATDAHNNAAFSSFTVTVTYNFNGFFAPVDNPPVVNTVKAGSAIPVKFSLGGNQGLGILASGSPTSGPVSCAFTPFTDPIEETMTAGSSSLQYDVTTGQYIYVWKTEKSWAGTCRVLAVKLIDGTTHYAYFKFNK